MAFPLAPINGQQFTEAANDRKWVYNSLKAAWVPADRSILNDFDDVDIVTTAPTNSQPLVYDGVNWVPQNMPTAGAFVPLIEATSNPVNGMTNLANAGTVWRNTSTQRAWISTQEANSVGLTVHQANVATNPAGSTAYTGGSIWGMNFIAAFDTTINSIGTYWTSIGNPSTITMSLYSGFGTGATLLASATPVVSATTGTNVWKDSLLDNEITLVAGNSYSVRVSTVGSSHYIGYTNTSALYPSQFDADSNGDATTASMIANGYVGVIRTGYNSGVPGTVWWPIDTFFGDGVASMQRLAAPPAAPVDGQVYYNTTISSVFVYDSENTNWIQCVN